MMSYAAHPAEGYVNLALFEKLEHDRKASRRPRRSDAIERLPFAEPQLLSTVFEQRLPSNQVKTPLVELCQMRHHARRQAPLGREQPFEPLDQPVIRNVVQRPKSPRHPLSYHVIFRLSQRPAGARSPS